MRKILWIWCLSFVIAAVNLAGFSALSQAVGGVPVCLNAPVHDTYSGADFAAARKSW